MDYLSLCSGIEAASVAWGPLGWEAAGFSEIEPFPSAVLAHHYPTVPNLGDMTNFKEWPDGRIDLMVGGTPCQSFSVAGLRKGLADPRGNLMLTYLAVADKYRPRWIVWENVPGVLSSGGGRDFGTFLGALGALGYGWAYRILDAQHFGVPQRRRRVFVVGCLGGWSRAAAVLFERHSLQGHPAPSREAREGVTHATGAGLEGGGELIARRVAHPVTCHAAKGGDTSTDNYVAHASPIAGALACSGGHAVPGTSAQDAGEGYLVAHEPIPYDLFQITAPINRQNRKPGDVMHTLAKDNTSSAAVLSFKPGQSGGTFVTEGYAPTLQAANNGSTAVPAVMAAMQVRRLTPRECERLQGFPDDYTLVEHRKKPAADGPRYKALGNSMAVPVMRWIGERIQLVDWLCEP